jgi:hypothetical protein
MFFAVCLGGTKDPADQKSPSAEDKNFSVEGTEIIKSPVDD